MTRLCNREECTVVETGRCALNNDPETCPERTGKEGSEDGKVKEDDDQLASNSHANTHEFHPGLELGLDDANRHMAGHYHHIIGILGAPEAGKTAALVSVYLLAANGQLEGFKYADSESLIAFEQLARGVRRWEDGAMPAEITSHTRLNDPRYPGFLHLRLFNERDRNSVDLLLPDLPGEWTDALIDKNNIGRLSFLERADTIWLFVDGRQLEDAKTRLSCIHRTRLLVRRLVENLGSNLPPLILVITRLDEYKNCPPAATDLKAQANEVADDVSIVEVASFSVSDDIAAGTGLPKLLKLTLASRAKAHQVKVPRLQGSRQILQYRNCHE